MSWYDSIGEFFTGSKSEEAQAAYDKYMQEMNAAKTGYTSAVDVSMIPWMSMAESGNYEQSFADYLDSLRGLDPQQYKVEGATTQAINPLENISSYIDPNVKYQQEAARQSIEESAAGRGGLFSGPTGSKIATTSEELAAKSWSDALNKAQNVQESENQRRINQQQASQSAGTFNFGLDADRSKALGSAYETAINPLETLTQTNLSKLGTMYGADTGLANVGYQNAMNIANQPSAWEELLGTVGVVGAAAPGLSQGFGALKSLGFFNTSAAGTNDEKSLKF